MLTTLIDGVEWELLLFLTNLHDELAKVPLACVSEQLVPDLRIVIDLALHDVLLVLHLALGNQSAKLCPAFLTISDVIDTQESLQFETPGKDPVGVLDRMLSARILVSSDVAGDCDAAKVVHFSDPGRQCSAPNVVIEAIDAFRTENSQSIFDSFLLVVDGTIQLELLEQVLAFLLSTSDANNFRTASLSELCCNRSSDTASCRNQHGFARFGVANIDTNPGGKPSIPSKK
mmetsp:Transcript_86551/g.153175  ORF Transcript_86551/g.153175 Transcript_86551/m.153175 type:complete len:231 (+) Transcript_86551:228-920(+)